VPESVITSLAGLPVSAAPPPSRAHWNTGGAQIPADRLPPNVNCGFDAPQRPPQPPLLSLLKTLLTLTKGIPRTWINVLGQTAYPLVFR
jgi:hypothetical protein